MIIKNKTHYFSVYTRYFNVVPDSHSFQMESSRRIGFFQRLYYEFEYTKSVGGCAFFWTLTYNDKSIPIFVTRSELYIDGEYKILEETHNVFNYDHVRLVTHGSLEKRLIREHGAKMKYFCACETGEGKGKRGLGRNPHYHFIFFVTPIDKEFTKFVTCWDMTRYVQECWQGKSGYCDWQSAKFGHAQAGKYLGQVLNADCLSYVAKYVVKDNNDLDLESKVYNHYFLEAKEHYLSYKSLYRFYKVLKNSSYYDKHKFFTRFGLHDYWFFKKRIRNLSYADWVKDVASDYVKSQVIQFKDWFVSAYCYDYAQSGLNKFINKYSGKVRCSKNLGEYGLQFIENPDSLPRLNVKVNHKYKLQYPCLFYIRKLYYDVVKCPFTGNPLYVLNERGRSLKVNTLQSAIDNLIHSVRDAVSYVVYNDLGVSIQDKPLTYFRSRYPDFDKYFKEDIDKNQGHFNGSYAQKILNEFIHYDVDGVRQSEILRRYAIYKIVYQYRHYERHSTISLDLNLSLDSVKEDYNWFLQQNVSLLDYNSGSIMNLFSPHLPMLFSFDSLIQFSPFIKYFRFFDILLDLVTSIYSDARKADFQAKKEFQTKIKRFQYDTAIG